MIKNKENDIKLRAPRGSELAVWGHYLQENSTKLVPSLIV